MKPIQVIVYDKHGPVPRATVRLNIASNAWLTGFTDPSGICAEFAVDDLLDDTQLEIYTCNYKDYSLHINLGTNGGKQIRVGMPPDPNRPQDIILPPIEKQYPNWTREQLLRFRGSLNIRSSKTYSVNINGCVSTNGAWHLKDEEVDSIISEYTTLRNYTHGPVGPFIDAGYHGLTPPTDFRNDNERERIEQVITYLQNNGIITPLFLTPDRWTVEQLRSIESIFKSDVWQNLGAIVVNGFEQQGSKYGWSNSLYVEYLSWVKEIFPNAVRGLHTVSKIEQPVGQGDDTSKPGMSPNECWGRVARYIDYWLYQDDMWDYGWSHIDPNGDGRTDLEHWYDLWNVNIPSSFVRRFSSTGSWNLASNIIPIPGEFWSYGLCWRNLPEDMGRAIGRAAISCGANGSFDGC